MLVLLGIALKSLLIAGTTLGLLQMMKRRSAAERSWVAHIGLVALVLRRDEFLLDRSASRLERLADWLAQYVDSHAGEDGEVCELPQLKTRVVVPFCS